MPTDSDCPAGVALHDDLWTFDRKLANDYKESHGEVKGIHRRRGGLVDISGPLTRRRRGESEWCTKSVLEGLRTH